MSLMINDEQKNISIRFHIAPTLYKRFYTALKKKGIKVNDRIRQLIAEDTDKQEQNNP